MVVLMSVHFQRAFSLVPQLVGLQSSFIPCLLAQTWEVGFFGYFSPNLPVICQIANFPIFLNEDTSHHVFGFLIK